MLPDNERQAPHCQWCNCVLTVKHVLVDCGQFTAQRRCNNLAGKPIEEILGLDADVQAIAKFLKAIHLFYDIY